MKIIYDYTDNKGIKHYDCEEHYHGSIRDLLFYLYVNSITGEAKIENLRFEDEEG